MNKKSILIVSLIIIIGLGFIIGSHFYNQWYHNMVKSKPQMWVYQTYNGPVRSALVIEDRNEYGLKLIDYYKAKRENPNTNIGIGVPLRTLPQYEPIYVLGYSNDSLLAEVVSYYDRGAYMGGSYLRGWVYIETLHEKPPSRK
jgi:hypothetical protein